MVRRFCLVMVAFVANEQEFKADNDPNDVEVGHCLLRVLLLGDFEAIAIVMRCLMSMHRE